MHGISLSTMCGVEPSARLARYRDVRAMTEALCRPLAVEDYVLQAMPDVSPTRWHLAHVSWFFETQESARYHPVPAPGGAGALRQMFGDVWEWTQSAYAPYPGYRPPDGAVGEHNGKFMVSQMVLRGGSCVTPRSHLRASYRNFFPPDARWQFSGIRLADDA